MPRKKVAVREGRVESEVEEDADARGRRGGGGGEPLRRSNRHCGCVQVKRFRHRPGKGSDASDPIELGSSLTLAEPNMTATRSTRMQMRASARWKDGSHPLILALFTACLCNISQPSC
jgi:hypothetical protein